MSFLSAHVDMKKGRQIEMGILELMLAERIDRIKEEKKEAIYPRLLKKVREAEQ